MQSQFKRLLLTFLHIVRLCSYEASVGETTARREQGIEFHIDALKGEGLDVPPPGATAALMDKNVRLSSAHNPSPATKRLKRTWRDSHPGTIR